MTLFSRWLKESQRQQYSRRKSQINEKETPDLGLVEAFLPLLEPAPRLEAPSPRLFEVPACGLRSGPPTLAFIAGACPLPRL